LKEALSTPDLNNISIQLKAELG